MSYSSILAAQTRAHQAFVNAQAAEAPKPDPKPLDVKCAKTRKALIYAELTHILSAVDKATGKAWQAERSLDVVTALSVDKYRQEAAQLRRTWQDFVAKHYGKDHPYYPNFRRGVLVS